MKFNILARSWKIKKSQTIWQNIEQKLPKTGSKMPFVAHFYSLWLTHAFSSNSIILKPIRCLETWLDFQNFWAVNRYGRPKNVPQKMKNDILTKYKVCLIFLTLFDVIDVRSINLNFNKKF